MDAERKARVALWSVGGVGPQALEQLQRDFGPLAGLLDAPMGDWLSRAQLLPGARRELAWYPSLAARCDETLRETQACNLALCFPGDAAWPQSLTGNPQRAAALVARGARRRAACRAAAWRWWARARRSRAFAASWCS